MCQNSFMKVAYFINQYFFIQVTDQAECSTEDEGIKVSQPISSKESGMIEVLTLIKIFL